MLSTPRELSSLNGAKLILNFMEGESGATGGEGGGQGAGAGRKKWRSYCYRGRGRGGVTEDVGGVTLYVLIQASDMLVVVLCYVGLWCTVIWKRGVMTKVVPHSRRGLAACLRVTSTRSNLPRGDGCVGCIIRLTATDSTCSCWPVLHIYIFTLLLYIPNSVLHTTKFVFCLPSFHHCSVSSFLFDTLTPLLLLHTLNSVLHATEFVFCAPSFFHCSKSYSFT